MESIGLWGMWSWIWVHTDPGVEFKIWSLWCNCWIWILCSSFVILIRIINTSLSLVLRHVWLCDPMDCNPPGSSLHGIFQARTLEWVAISYYRGIFLTQRLNSSLLCLLHWQVDSLPLHRHSLCCDDYNWNRGEMHNTVPSTKNSLKKCYL